MAARAYVALLVAFTVGTLSVARVDFPVRMPLDSSGDLVGLNHPRGGNHWVGAVVGLTFVSAGLLAIASSGLPGARLPSRERRAPPATEVAGCRRHDMCRLSCREILIQRDSAWVINIFFPVGL